jgi:hypothetical protein
MLKCTVEYMFKKESRKYKDTPTITPFNSVDDAVAFIRKMKKAFKGHMEWMYIHVCND